MAFGVGTLWEARTTGSNTICSGGFNPEQTNMATDGTATNATGDTPTFSSASYTFVSGDIGAKLFIKSGTNWTPGWYEIDSISGSSAVLKAAIGEGISYAGGVASSNQTLSYQASTVAGCATTASPTGATWTVDYSQQDSARFAFTDLASVTTTTITSAAKPFGKNCIGNTIKITAGTSWTVQTVQITNVVTTTATVDKTVGGAGLSSGTGYLGGALAGPQLALAIAASSNKIFVKSGSYTVSSTTSNASNGRMTMAATTLMQGYDSYRGDRGTPPIFTVSGVSTFTIITGASDAKVINVKVDGSNQTSVSGFTLSAASAATINCIAVNCTNGFRDGTHFRAYADTCTTGFTVNSGTYWWLYCVADSCTTGYSTGSNGFLLRCVSTGCTTGYNDSAAPGTNRFINCIAYSSTNGFVFTNSNVDHFLLNCIAANSSTRGFDLNGGNAYLINCAGYSNTTADYRYNASNGPGPFNFDFITLSADPFTNAAGGDFSLNDTVGGGASLRGIAMSYGAFTTSTSYEDIGAAQHLETAGGGGGDDVVPGTFPYRRRRFGNLKGNAT